MNLLSRAFAPALLLSLALTGCANADGPDAQATSSPAADETSAAQSSDSSLSVVDPWAKAADEGMTAAFGTLVNDTDSDITIVAASSDVSAMELHEMAMNDSGEMVMRPKEGGIVVPAHGEHILEPGSDHIMFMALDAPLEPGAEVDITLVASDDSQWTVTFPVRTFTGADESYDPNAGETMGDMGDMGDMGSEGMGESNQDG